MTRGPGSGERDAPGSRRRDALRGLLARHAADALLVTRIENLRYLSGFTGSSAALLVSEAEAILVTDSRYAEQAAAEAPGVRVEIVSGLPAVAALRLAPPPCRLAFEAEAVSYATWEALQREAGGRPGMELVGRRELVETLRARKDDDELARLRRAAAIAGEAFEATLPLVKPGAVERDLALEIEWRMRRAGAEAVAFELIVASGPRSALPHGRADGRRLAAGEFVVFDIGARYEGYHSDMTRTVHTGRPDGEERLLYETVLEAQRRALDALRPGAAARAVDAAARSVIEAAGHGRRFGHGTGHGVGLLVHEAPRVAPQSSEVLEAGMVVTVEPGIYFPGRRGVRIEDMALVAPGGAVALTSSPKDSWVLE